MLHHVIAQGESEPVQAQHLKQQAWVLRHLVYKQTNMLKHTHPLLV